MTKMGEFEGKRPKVGSSLFKTREVAGLNSQPLPGHQLC